MKNARDRVVKLSQPSNDPRDFFTIASLPQQTKDELMTLAQGSCLVTIKNKFVKTKNFD